MSNADRRGRLHWVTTAARGTGETKSMSTTTASLASVLNSLIETCKDGQEGFRNAAENVKDADLKSLFSELSMQRRQFITELQVLVRGLGEETEKTGSVAGALHRGWIDLKAALTSGDEHAILAECERGEDSAVAEYRDALAHGDLPANVRGVLRQQSMAVQAAHDRVRDLRDRFQE
ncbi:MAG: hypothetical protein QOE70_1091 [Chthoniobacter sp.]|jgi:uncharacterized protein (TIGR02284 family)|nr:hypothetical protein [Chthoniobacter sp.]